MTSSLKDLTHYLLKILSNNIDSEYPQRIFEIGTTFKYEGNKIKENEKLAVALTPGNFTETRQVLEYLSKMLNIKIKLKETKEIPPYFIEGRIGEIILNNKSIGFVGEIHPKILKNWKIKMPIALFEINLEEIFNKLK